MNKAELISKIIISYTENEGQDVKALKIRKLRIKLNNFTVDELKLFLKNRKN